MIPKTRPRGSELKAELVPAMMFLDEAVESLRIVARQFIRVGSQEGVEPLDQCIIIPPREIHADGRINLLIQHLVRAGRDGGGGRARRSALRSLRRDLSILMSRGHAQTLAQTRNDPLRQAGVDQIIRRV